MLGHEDKLTDEDGPSIDEIMEMDIDRLGSKDDIEEGRFSRTEAKRTFEAHPVLEAANRLRADLRQEGFTPKVTGDRLSGRSWRGV